MLAIVQKDNFICEAFGSQEIIQPYIRLLNDDCKVLPIECVHVKLYADKIFP